jgi:putative hydrolase of the HAD superfamily
MADFSQPAVVKAILLDMDDTIIADDPFTQEAWWAACNNITGQLPGFSAAVLKTEIDKVRELYWKDPETHRIGRLNLAQARREIVNIAFSCLKIDAPVIANGLADLFTAEKERLCSPFPGALETLQVFKDQGFRLALLTNGGSDIQRQKINRFGLGRFFDHIIIEGEFGTGKPDERVFRSALEVLHVKPGESWMVGDDLGRDIDGAQRLGIHAIWVDFRKTGLPPDSSIKPDRIISSIAELI